jgi:hypothetical protein
MEELTRSDWTAIGSLVIAGIALWRALVAPVRSLQTSVFREAAELRVEINALEPKIALGVQSRQRVLAATGSGLGGNYQIFKNEADADFAEVTTLKGRLAEIERRDHCLTYRTVEGKVAAVTGLRARVRQLAEKYAAAMAADDATRQYLRDAATQRVLAMRDRGERS